MLTDPATRAAVAASFDEDDPEPIAEAVLSLVAKAGLRPGEQPWLAELALPGDDGEIYPAGNCCSRGRRWRTWSQLTHRSEWPMRN